ncbi:MAG: transposase [Deltaproteobacteria bacterium]|nr:transposase [Deltaproteobacteria bacterium]
MLEAAPDIFTRGKDKEFLRHPFYGSRKMRDYLNRRGFPVNRKRVQRLMALNGY